MPLQYEIRIGLFRFFLGVVGRQNCRGGSRAARGHGGAMPLRTGQFVWYDVSRSGTAGILPALTYDFF
jgi:hypothetical protein